MTKKKEKHEFDEEFNNWKRGMRTVITCGHCNTSIYSPTSGAYICCKCDKTFVDQTPYYCRIGGDLYTTKSVALDELEMISNTKTELI